MAAKKIGKKTAPKKKRNYKKEYANYHAKPAVKKRRALNNKANRDSGTYGNGDGKDVAHSKPKAKGTTKLQSPAKNRSFKRTTKSRRK